MLALAGIRFVEYKYQIPYFLSLLVESRVDKQDFQEYRDLLHVQMEKKCNHQEMEGLFKDL